MKLVAALNAWTLNICLPAAQEIDEYQLVGSVDILTPLETAGFQDGVVSAPYLVSMLLRNIRFFISCTFFVFVLLFKIMEGNFVLVFFNILLVLLNIVVLIFIAYALFSMT